MQITKFSGSTPVRRPPAVCSKPTKICTNLTCSEISVHWPHFCRWQLRPTFIQSRMASSEVNNIRTSSVPSVKCTLSCTGHSRSFKVILIGADMNQERIVSSYCAINADDISEAYEDIETRKLQIGLRRFQRPYPGLKTRNAFKYLQMVYIARNYM